MLSIPGIPGNFLPILQMKLMKEIQGDQDVALLQNDVQNWLLSQNMAD